MNMNNSSQLMKYMVHNQTCTVLIHIKKYVATARADYIVVFIYTLFIMYT